MSREISCDPDVGLLAVCNGEGEPFAIGGEAEPIVLAGFFQNGLGLALFIEPLDVDEAVAFAADGTVDEEPVAGGDA